MKGNRLIPALAILIPFMAAFHPFPSNAATGAAALPGQAHLTEMERARLLQAAADASLEPWQRQFMEAIAAAGDPGAFLGAIPASTDDPGTPAPANPSSTAVDGVWASLVQQTSPTPEPRASHAGAYDSMRNRMLVFGGRDPFRSDVWALTLGGSPTWSKILPVGAPPSARELHAAIYDPVRDRLLVFGGWDGGFLNDVWSLSLGGKPQWTMVAPTGAPPSPRYSPSAIYDPVRDRMVVFGGYNNNNLNDTWVLSLAGSPAWSQLGTLGAPPAGRNGHSAIYDPTRDRMVIYAGAQGAASFDDVWALSLASSQWTQVLPAGTQPAARGYHTAVYDSQGDRMIIFGGDMRSPAFNDAWALSFAGSGAWTQLSPSGPLPSPRTAHVSVYDPLQQRMVTFGGQNVVGCCTAVFLNETWSLSLSGSPSWSRLAPPSIPSARSAHTAIADPTRDRMWVFAGQEVIGCCTPSFLNDTWSLGLSVPTAWSEIGTSGTPPPPRASHTAIYDPVRDRIIVFGGRDPFRNDVWTLSLAGTPTWSQLFPAGTPPSPRELHTAIYDPVRDRMVTFGGWDGGFLNDLWALSLSGTPTWSALSAVGPAPDPRYSESAIYDPVRDRMVLFGGYRYVTDRRSGAITDQFFNDTWELPLDRPSWKQLRARGALPSGRNGHSAIYDPVRDRMVVFGGARGAASLNDTWALALGRVSVWTQLQPSGGPPAVRGYHTAVYDAARDRMVVFAGDQRSPALNDTWALTWSTPTPGNAVATAGGGALGLRLLPSGPRGAVRLEYALPSGGPARLDIFNVTGQRLRTLLDTTVKPRGEISWDGARASGERLPSGIYFARLSTGARATAARIVLIR